MDGALAAAILMVATPEAVAAQSISVSPTLIEVPAGKRGAVVEIANRAAKPVDIQVRPYDWRQIDGEDVLEPDTQLLLSPSVVTIPANGTQTLRILTPTASRSREGEWRLLLDQLPDTTGSGLQIRLRMSIPVIAHATHKDAAEVRWSMTATRLVATNIGGRFALLKQLAVRDVNGRQHDIGLGTSGYLLPGAARSWPLPGDVATHISAIGITVTGVIGTQDFTAPLNLDPPR